MRKREMPSTEIIYLLTPPRKGPEKGDYARVYCISRGLDVVTDCLNVASIGS